MSRINTTSCCGLRELEGIMEHEDPKDCLMAIGARLIEIETAFVVFTCPENEDYGQELKQYINANDLGNVIQSTSRFNPNSDNDLIMWVWEIEMSEFEDWFLGQTELANRPATPTTGFEVGQLVRHDTYGVGTVRTIRTDRDTSIGVEFVVTPNGAHSLNDAIEDENGKWCSVGRLSPQA